MIKYSNEELLNLLKGEINLRRTYLRSLVGLFNAVTEINFEENENLLKTMNLVNETLNEDMDFLRKFTPEELEYFQ